MRLDHNESAIFALITVYRKSNKPQKAFCASSEIAVLAFKEQNVPI